MRNAKCLRASVFDPYRLMMMPLSSSAPPLLPSLCGSATSASSASAADAASNTQTHPTACHNDAWVSTVPFRPCSSFCVCVVCTRDCLIYILTPLRVASLSRVAENNLIVISQFLQATVVPYNNTSYNAHTPSLSLSTSIYMYYECTKHNIDEAIILCL